MFPSPKKDWKNFKTNNKTIAVKVLYVPHNNEKIRHAYISMHNSMHKNRVILFMIADGKKWYYLFVKIPSALFRGITSNIKA